MKGQLKILFMALILFFYPASLLFASSIEVPAIGGNFSGPVADNVAAVFWNPSALGQLEGTNVLGTVNLSFLNFTYDADTDPWTGEPKDYPKVKSSTFSPPPFLGIASDIGMESIGLENLIWGIAFYTPFGGTLDWPKEVTLDGSTEPAPQRFQATKVSNQCLTFGPAVAYRILPSLMIGAGANYNYGSLNAKLSFKYEEPEWDFEFEEIPLTIKISDLELETNEKDLSASAFGWNAGILWKPLDNLDIGVSYTNGLNFTLKGDIEVKSDQEVNLLEINESPVSGDPVSVDILIDGKGTIELEPFKLPPIINAGAEYRPTDRIELDFAFRWEGWSVRKDSDAIINVAVQGTADVDIDAEQFNEPLPIDDVISEAETLKWGLEDIFAFRVWGMYKLLESLKVGAGFGWEQGASPNEVISVENYSTDRIRIFGGAQWNVPKIENLIAELNYFHAIYKKLTLKEGESEKDPPVTGKFTGMLDIITFGVAYKF